MSIRVSDFAAGPRFILLHVVWFAGWITANLVMRRPFDRFPFTFLTLVVSLEAIVLTSFVLMSQKHMEGVSHRRAELDLQINLLAEAEMTRLLRSINAIAEHLGVDAVCDDPDLQAMATETDIEEIAAQVAAAAEEQIS